MKLKKIIETKSSLSELANLPLPAIKAFELKKFLKNIDEEVKMFWETRDEVVKKYWYEKEKWSFIVKDECMADFVKEIDQLLDKEINIEVPQISLQEIKWDIKTSILIDLDYIIWEQ